MAVGWIVVDEERRVLTRWDEKDQTLYTSYTLVTRFPTYAAARSAAKKALRWWRRHIKGHAMARRLRYSTRRLETRA